MRKLIMTAVVVFLTATSVFAQSYTQDIISKLPQTKKVVVCITGTGGLFQIPSFSIGFKKEWITNISSTTEYLKINAENEKRSWELLISNEAIGNVSLVSKINKKTKETETYTKINVNENASTPAFIDYLMQEYNKEFTSIVFPGPFFPVGTKYSKIAKLTTHGDVLGIINTNGWETYNSFGAISVLCKSTQKKNDKVTISCLGIGAPNGKDLGKLVVDKCAAGEVSNIAFYGVSIPPCVIDEYTTVNFVENNFVKISRTNSDNAEVLTQYQKFSRVKSIVKKGKNMFVSF